MTRNAGSREIIDFLTPGPESIRLAGVSLSLGLGCGWAMALTVGGGLLASLSPGAAAWLAGSMLAGGLTLAVAGLFVFMVTVGSRLFPGASSRVRRNTEALLGVAVVIGLACTALTLLS